MEYNYDDILSTINRGAVRDRIDMSDITFSMLYLFGLDRDDAYYLTKCATPVPPTAVTTQSKAYLDMPRIKGTLDALRPFVDSKKGKMPSSMEVVTDWTQADVASLTAEELEKMGTYLLRAASVSNETSPKDINDLIKMLDSIGALPKKEKDEKDFKQVIIQPLFNSICQNCQHEVYVNVEPEIRYVEVDVERKTVNEKGMKIVDL